MSLDELFTLQAIDMSHKKLHVSHVECLLAVMRPTIIDTPYDWDKSQIEHNSEKDSSSKTEYNWQLSRSSTMFFRLLIRNVQGGIVKFGGIYVNGYHAWGVRAKWRFVFYLARIQWGRSGIWRANRYLKGPDPFFTTPTLHFLFVVS